MRSVPPYARTGREREKNMQQMKMPGMAMVCLFAVALMAATRGFAQYVTPGEVTVIVKKEQPPPQYALWEGVNAAITSLRQRGVPITFDNVNEELYVMHRNNDIHLPYDPYWRGHMKRPLTKKKREKVAFENELRRRIETLNRSGGAETGVAANPEPRPGQFSSKDKFVNAYVAYKMEMADDGIRARYRRKIGGMSDYRREMQREAAKLWKEVRGR